MKLVPKMPRCPLERLGVSASTNLAQQATFSGMPKRVAHCFILFDSFTLNDEKHEYKTGRKRPSKGALHSGDIRDHGEVQGVSCDATIGVFNSFTFSSSLAMKLLQTMFSCILVSMFSSYI